MKKISLKMKTCHPGFQCLKNNTNNKQLSIKQLFLQLNIYILAQKLHTVAEFNILIQQFGSENITYRWEITSSKLKVFSFFLSSEEEKIKNKNIFKKINTAFYNSISALEFTHRLWITRNVFI